jgi:hypothetical protein
MDRSRTVFLAAAGLLTVGVPFLGGLYAAHHDMAVYRKVFEVWDNATTLIDEIPNLRGTEPIHFLQPARYEGDGVTLNDPRAGASDLILLSGFLKDDNYVRLIRRDGSVVNEWRLRALDKLANPAQCRNPPMTNWNAIPHGTIATPEGDIVISFESCGMVRLDRCNKVKFSTAEITHHSPNWLADGGIVIAGGEYVDKAAKDLPWPFDGPYWEDLVYKFDADGKLTLRKPVTELFIENQMAPQLTAGSEFRTRVDGEFHLNEVEELSPELAPAFPMFAAGDLMLNFRNLNMIVVTDATATKVKWFKTGPYVRQHDPDFGADGRITMFDNHSDGSLDGSREGGSRVWSVDPATDQATLIYGAKDGQRMYSPERSTHQMLPNGDMMVTEAQAGRAFEVTAGGDKVWEYVNRWDASRIAWLHDAEVYAPGFFTVTDWSCAAE